MSGNTKLMISAERERKLQFSLYIMNSQVLKIYSVGLSALEMKYHKHIIVTNYC